MIRRISFFSLAFAAALASAQPAWAYVGPGVGLSMMSSMLGLGLTILTAGAAAFIWPLKRWWRSRRDPQTHQD